LQSLRTPDEVADIRGLSVNQVLGLTTKDEVASETLSAAPSSNGNGGADAASAEEPESEQAEEPEA
jgi:small subunit ribosomal protein S5